MAGQMLRAKEMQEVKGLEIALNARQKREGTKHPIIHIIWGCGCCYGPSPMTYRTILTAEEGMKYMKFRKAIDNLNRRKDRITIPAYERLYKELCAKFNMNEKVGVQQYNFNHKVA